MKTKIEIEKEFDERFRHELWQDLVKTGASMKEIKSHISSLRKNDIGSVRGWVEKLDIDEIFAEQVKEKIVSHLSEELKNL